MARRGSQTIKGHFAGVDDGHVYVSLDPPFQYFGCRKPLDGGDPISRARQLFDELASTWEWLLRTPDVLVDRIALKRAVASTSWYVSLDEIGRRLGGWFDDHGKPIASKPTYQEIHDAWSVISEFSYQHLARLVDELARRHGCPHPQCLWQVWDMLDLAPLPLDDDD